MLNSFYEDKCKNKDLLNLYHDNVSFFKVFYDGV